MQLNSGKDWLEEKYKYQLCLLDYAGWNNSEEDFRCKLLTEKEFLDKVLKSNYNWNISKL